MKKIKLIFLLIYISLFINSFGQKNCENFKTGNFTYKEVPFNKTKVKRTKKFQFEHNKLDGMRLKFQIVWMSPCEYHLTYLKINDKSFKNLIGKKLTVKITEIIDSKTYKYIADYYGEKTSFTMIKD